VVANGILVEKCRSMDSAKAPLWVVFTNADPLGQPINVIFKCGDDLRQDLLTLQMLGIMDDVRRTHTHTYTITHTHSARLISVRT
jgi:phosphatidylinositol-4,5-bisphosphate 3-kinase